MKIKIRFIIGAWLMLVSVCSAQSTAEKQLTFIGHHVIYDTIPGNYTMTWTSSMVIPPSQMWKLIESNLSINLKQGAYGIARFNDNYPNHMTIDGILVNNLYSGLENLHIIHDGTVVQINGGLNQNTNYSFEMLFINLKQATALTLFSGTHTIELDFRFLSYYPKRFIRRMVFEKYLIE
jgi:hypothetical protein